MMITHFAGLYWRGSRSWIQLLAVLWLALAASAPAMESAPKKSSGGNGSETLLTPSASATVENPFVHRAFIKERDSILAGDPSEGARGDGFAYYLFETDSMVSTGHSAIGFTSVFSNPGMMPAYHRTHQYVVDHHKGKIRIGDNLEYYYKIEGSVLQLWNMTQSHTLYEVGVPFFLADQNSVYWQIVRRHDEKMREYGPVPLAADYNIMEQHKDRAGRQMKNYIDSFIARAKGAPVIPLPDASPSPNSSPSPSPRPSPSPSPSPQADTNVITGVNPPPSPPPEKDDDDAAPQAEPVDGEYLGFLVGTDDASRRKFEMSLRSIGGAAGRPTTVPVRATMKFEGTETEEVLAGTAAYGAGTSITLAGSGADGTTTLQAGLTGDRLSGTWQREAGRQTTQGLLEAARTGP